MLLNMDKGKLALILESNSLLHATISADVKDIRRRVEAQKRGSGLNNVTHVSMDDEEYVEEVSNVWYNDEDALNSTVREVLALYQKDRPSRDINMMVDYYVIGYTYEEIGEKYNLNKSTVMRALDKFIVEDEYLAELLYDIRKLRGDYA